MLVSQPKGKILLDHALQSVWGRRCLSTSMPAWYPPPCSGSLSGVGKQAAMCHHTGKMHVCMCVCAHM